MISQTILVLGLRNCSCFQGISESLGLPLREGGRKSVAASAIYGRFKKKFRFKKIGRLAGTNRRQNPLDGKFSSSSRGKEAEAV
ncbi:hypothetical protein R1flu_012806 [Riccia fluitans]|uniref:Uncharacterized protein n=1 Tax=Riccia fluitans TaxID=41844 RepID=A0ABD1ZCU3_9MARC